jgi:spore maturation protein CgeB
LEQAKMISLASFSPSNMRGTAGITHCLRLKTATSPSTTTKANHEILSNFLKQATSRLFPGMGAKEAYSRVTTLLIVGFGEPGHMGSYLAAAARQLGLDCKVIDAGRADARSRLVRAFYWRFLDRRPVWLRRFSAEVMERCIAIKPDVVLTTGHAPLDRPHIERLRGLGIKVINYSTDDPWNPAQRANWFLSALPAYDAVFTTRRANLDDFRRCSVQAAYYLPFAYDPEIHRPWPETVAAGAPSDVLFVGGCDPDRLDLIRALLEAGLDLALFGGYWDRFSETRPHWRGIVDQDVIRAASVTARLCLCLVRRANRDGSVMRSFEAAAIGGCILAEDTPDHRELFGPDDNAVRYFATSSQMVHQAKRLVADVEARHRLSRRLQERVECRKETYANRLASMLRISVPGWKQNEQIHLS